MIAFNGVAFLEDCYIIRNDKTPFYLCGVSGLALSHCEVRSLHFNAVNNGDSDGEDSRRVVRPAVSNPSHTALTVAVNTSSLAPVAPAVAKTNPSEPTGISMNNFNNSGVDSDVESAHVLGSSSNSVAVVVHVEESSVAQCVVLSRKCTGDALSMAALAQYVAATYPT